MRAERAGWGTYALLALFTAVSLLPLLWTAVAASRTSTRLAATPPPFRFGRNLPRNLEIAWTDARLGEALANTALVAGDMGYSGAISLLVLIVNLALALLYLRMLRRRRASGEAR